MNTTEKNILIAEFMGFKLQTDPTEKFFGQWLINPATEIAWSNREKILFFECDWNWLMQVVEKIESLIFDNDEYYNVHILGGCCVYVISSHCNELICSDKGQSKLECVYNACVEFILWFNENKK